MSKTDLGCIPVLVGCPLVAYFFPHAIMIVILLYLVVGMITRYYWPCVTTPLGAIITGSFFGPQVNGGAEQEIIKLSLGAVLGLAFGMLLHELRQDKSEKPD
ncbi:MAG: hypothetical protein HUJ26_21475 [Planctomycetaceae bacterium]|nr:hypothetical protein [Planctomycetaceae bacterium]